MHQPCALYNLKINNNTGIALWHRYYSKFDFVKIIFSKARIRINRKLLFPNDKEKHMILDSVGGPLRLNVVLNVGWKVGST